MGDLVGIYRLDGGPVDGGMLSSMLAAVAPGGGGAAWTAGSAGLGYAATAAPAGGPGLGHFDGGLAVAADTRLDNRPELLSALGLDGEEADHLVVTRAYARWGENCPGRLLGDFAIAIWDGARRHLLCARDPLGIRPLFYARTGSLFAFASRIPSLLALPEVPRRLDERSVADYLEGTEGPPGATFYRDIHRLPPGHLVSVTPAGEAVRAYWSLASAPELSFRTDADYTAAFAEIFRESVRARLRGCRRVGIEVSGGLDSSSIAGAASALANGGSGPDLAGLSVVFGDPPGNRERPFVDAIYARCPTLAPHFIHFDRVAPMAELDRVQAAMDEPFVAPSIHWPVYRAAARAGLRVLLDGIDGDGVMWGGHDGIRDLIAGRRFALAGRTLLSRLRGGPPRIRWGRRRDEATPVIGPDFAARINVDRATRPAGVRPGRSWSRATHVEMLTSARFARTVEEYGQTAAAFGVELRHPFLDRRLVEFCVGVPLRRRGAGRWNRIILRRAMAESAPPGVVWRAAKGSFAPNVTRALQAREHARLAELLRRGREALAGYVDLDALDLVHRRFEARGALADAATCWDVAILGHWLLHAPLAG